MGGGHAHTSSTSAGGAHRGRLLVVLAISAAVLVVELVGAAVTGSLALFADAGHVATDVGGTLLAVLALTFAARPATPKRTFGYYRLEILAAVINAVLLFGVAAVILIEAFRRWSEPPEVASGLMIVFACIGLVANIAGMVILRSGARESLNVRGAYLEVFGDMLGSIAVIIAAVIIATTGWLRADVVASVAVALLILPRTWSLLRDAVDVLLEATPRGVDLDVVRQHILRAPGVLGVHDVHAWTITSGLPVFSAHVVVADEVLADGGGARLLDELSSCLAGHFDVEHSTFQFEPSSHAEHEFGTHE
jgi:cobalt-zinc-cadmium efflux system protein